MSEFTNAELESDSVVILLAIILSTLCWLCFKQCVDDCFLYGCFLDSYFLGGCFLNGCFLDGCFLDD